MLTYQEISGIREVEKDKIKEGKIIMPQVGFQERGLSTEAHIIIAAGSRGSGKSGLLLMNPLQYTHHPRFNALMFRVAKDDIKRGLIHDSKRYYSNFGEYTDTNLRWSFDSGSTVEFTYLKDDGTVDDRFRGLQYCMFGFDEITQIAESSFWDLLRSNRNPDGISCKMIGTCNPNKDSWVYKLVQWYIDDTTGAVIPERDGVIRYFFKYGKTIEEIIWGNSPEEVYEKSKSYIDRYMKEAGFEDGNPHDMVESIVFIRGGLKDNKFLSKEYIKNVSQGGVEKTEAELLGLWKDSTGDNEMLSAYDFRDKFFETAPQTTGIKYITADIALEGNDKNVIICWDGFHIFDIIVSDKLTGMEAKDLLISTARRYRIPNNRIIFDANGIGSFIGGKNGSGFIPKSVSFRGGDSPTDKGLYFNSRSECYCRFADRIKQNSGYSIDKTLLKKTIGKMTIEEILQDERRVIRAYQKGVNWREIFRLIPKEDMKKIIGHSPDFMDAITMREYADLRFLNAGKRFGSIW